MRYVAHADTSPSNMVYLRDDVTKLMVNTIKRFEAQATLELLKSIGDVDLYYDFCFSKYDKVMADVHNIPVRDSAMMFGSDRKSSTVVINIQTELDAAIIKNDNGNFGGGMDMPYLVYGQEDMTNRRTAVVELSLVLTKARYARGINRGFIKGNQPLIMSPGMDNYELIMEKSRALVMIHNKLKLYVPLIRFIIGSVGTTTKLRTIWPQVLPFLPAESRRALKGSSRKAWPIGILRAAEASGWNQDALAKTLANIAANVAHASMLPDTIQSVIEREFINTVSSLNHSIALKTKLFPNFPKPPNYPDYRTDTSYYLS